MLSRGLNPEAMRGRALVWIGVLIVVETLFLGLTFVTTPRRSTVQLPATSTPISKSGPQSTTAGGDRTSTPRVTVPNVLSYGCDAALSYLAEHAAPGFRSICPGYANGRQAMTCDLHEKYCPRDKVIIIAVPCPAAYMNEAHNSWVLEGLVHGSLDPYGWCR